MKVGAGQEALVSASLAKRRDRHGNPPTEKHVTDLSIEHCRHPGMSRGLTLVFAIAGGAAVGNLYWAQPLLTEIATSLDVPTGVTGLLITMTQVGYALGVLFLVPLGDTLNRRRLIPAIMVCSALALAASALAPSFSILLATFAAVGLTTVGGQLLTPLAGDLAHADQRGRVVGTVASGLMMGILLARTISGFLSDALGWRAIYVAAAILMIGMAFVLGRSIPTDQARPAVPYGKLLASVFAAVRRHRSVQVTLVLGATTFAVFTMFWTGLTFLLSSQPFSYSASQIGLVGLLGFAGALATQRAGWLHDRGWSTAATGIGLAVTLLSLAVAGLGSTSTIMVLIAVLLLNVAIPVVNVLNQTRLFSVDPNARSRLNTAFIVGNFVGGAIGSTLTGVLWEHGGWTSLTLGEAALIGLALVVWLTQRRALPTA
jgi:predicted MFS family arabinose efflux permease